MPFLLQKKRARVIAIRKMTLFRDPLARAVLKDKKACEHILNVILNRNLTVIDVQVQRLYPGLAHRDVILDVVAEDENDVLYNIEIQIGTDPDHARRIRLYKAKVDSEILEHGARVDALPNLYMIYISLKDVFHTGRTMDIVESQFKYSKVVYDDGVHIISVNAEIHDGSNVADLMQYFVDADPNDMSQGALSKRVRFLKEEEEGLQVMDEYVESLMHEAAQDAAHSAKVECLIYIIQQNHDVEYAMNVIGIKEDEKPLYRALVDEALQGVAV